MADEKRNQKGKPAQHSRPWTDKGPGRAGSRPGGEKRSFDRPAGPRPDSERKPYGRPAGPRPDGERKPYGRPAGPRQDGEKKPYGRPANPRPDGDQRYGRPAGPRQEGERKPYGRPANPRPEGEQRYGRPAAPKPDGDRMPYGRPAEPRQDGDKKPYGRSAGPRQDGDRKPYGRPAGPRPEGEQRYGRPAAPRPEGDQRYGRPTEPRHDGERKIYGRPAGPSPEGEQRSYGRPAGPRQDGERKVYGRPAGPRPEGEQRSYGRPAAPRPAGPRPGGSTFAAPQSSSLSLDARRSALMVLNRVLNESGYAALSLDDHFKTVRLSPQDKRLCTRIVYQTLENLGRLDFALDSLLEDPERLEKRVRNLLRLSACQILLLDRVPDSAAVNEAVKITRDMGLEDMTGLVNGVLRNLIRKKDEMVWPTPEEGSRYYEIMHSQPAWLVAQLQKDYGEDEAHRILTWQPEDHRLILRPNLMRLTPEGMEELLQKKGWRYGKGQMPLAWYVYGASDITRDEDYMAGAFSIQGEGSMLAAEAMQAGLGQQVLDTCAAPGGKSAYMAEQMQGTGRVQAWDVHEHRVELIQALAERLRLYNIRPAVRDALVYREQLETMMDAVLIDAPCTGTGVLADKPDLKQRVNEDSLHQLLETQRRLLDTCSRYVKPGGTLVYATCSLLPDENQRQVESFLLTHPAFEMTALPDSIPANLRAAEGPLGLQLLPHRDGVEGFYVARMRRK